MRVPRLSHDAGYARRLQLLLEKDSLFTSLRINRAAASVVATYQAGIADAKMHKRLIDLIQTASKIIFLTSADEPAATDANETDSGWQLPALATTLAVLGGPMGLPIPPLIVAGTIAAATRARSSKSDRWNYP